MEFGLCRFDYLYLSVKQNKTIFTRHKKVPVIMAQSMKGKILADAGSGVRFDGWAGFRATNSVRNSPGSNGYTPLSISFFHRGRKSGYRRDACRQISRIRPDKADS